MAKLSFKRHNSANEVRVRYSNKVDEHAEMVRCRYITKGDGQAMSYEAKYQQALIYQNGNPNGLPLKWLEREAEGTGQTVESLAGTIIAQHEQWEEIGSEIEKQRLKAKKAIKEATTVHEAFAAYKAFTESVS